MTTESAVSLADIPLANGLPLIGNLLDMIRSPVEFLYGQHRELGDIFRVHVATKTYIVLAGVEANLLMSGSQRSSFSSRETWGDFVEKTHCPHLLIGTDGEAHTYQRKLLKPFFARDNFRNRYLMLKELTEEQLNAVVDRHFKVGPFVRNLICQQNGLVLQNKRVSTRQSETFMHAQNTLLNVYMVGKWPRLALLNPWYWLAQYQTNRFSRQLLAERYDQQQNNELTGIETYMDKVEQGRREHPEWFTDGDIHAHTMMPFTGGVDPAGGAMSFLLYELLKHPELARRVQKEVDHFCQKGFPDFDALEEMQNLHGFIYEVLRLHPTGFALSRTASRDIAFRGHVIPAGSELLIFNSANHFNGNHFPKPEHFDIERYREPRREHKARAVFAPFGRGPHTCVGNALAELQLKIFAIVLLRNFQLEAVTPLHKLKTIYLPGPFMSHNFRVRIRRRQH